MKQTIEAKKGAKGSDTVGCAKKDSATTSQGHTSVRSEPPSRKGGDGTALTHAIRVTGQVPPLQGGMWGGGPPGLAPWAFILRPSGAPHRSRPGSDSP
jgi:hypothetical protein